MRKIQFTPDGFKQIQEELQDIMNNKLPAARIRLGKARAQGDLSENSEYHAAKEDLAFADGRRAELELLIKFAEVIDPNDAKGIQLGAEVVVERDGRTETYSIVGEFEADPVNKKLSATSPIGSALMGKNEGDIVTVEVPAGKLKYKIVKIKK